MADYEIEIGRHRLALGQRIVPLFIGEPRLPTSRRWDMAAGVYTVDSLVETLDFLLEAVIHQLGEEADRESLLDGLEASLSTGGSESVLPLDVFTFADTARVEIAEQARRIGAALVGKARRANGRRVGLGLAGPGQLDGLTIRSPCEGYQWTGPVIRQLMGPGGGREVMQLYNEWLHQFVLLRDGLLPFTNWEAVPLVIGRSGTDAGMRMIEPLRERFVAKLLTQRLPHAAIVELAHGLFADGPPGGSAYGFQGPLGLALPAVLGERLEQAPRYLLTWHPARLFETSKTAVTAFFPLLQDYLADLGGDVTRTPLQGGPLVAVTGQLLARSEGTTATITLELQSGDATFACDLGQALRGHRFLVLPSHGLASARSLEVEPTSHAAGSILSQDRLVQATSGSHVVGAAGDPLIALGLLGKIVPENLILRLGEDWDVVLGAGKGFGGRFIIDLDGVG